MRSPVFTLSLPEESNSPPTPPPFMPLNITCIHFLNEMVFLFTPECICNYKMFPQILIFCS